MTLHEFRRDLQQSVKEARAQAGLTLSAKGEVLGDLIRDTSRDIATEDYRRGEPPAPERLTRLRNAALDILMALAVYGVSGRSE